MTSSRTVAVGIRAAERSVSRDVSDEARRLLQELAAASERFGDRHYSQVLAKLQALKPRAETGGRKSQLPPLLGEALSLHNQYKGSLGDLRASEGVIGRVDKLSKADVVAIAAHNGMRSTTKTTKANALKHLSSMAAQAERDNDMARKIKLGR